MRYYSTDLGRWVNRDPLGDEGFRLLNSYLVRRILFDKNESARAADPEPDGRLRIIQDELLEGDVVALTGANLYTVFRNSPITVIDPYGLKCKIVIVMGHASFVSKKIKVGKPDKCDRFGAVSCFIDSKMDEAKKKWGDILIPGWPSHPGLLYCKDVPDILKSAGSATTTEEKAMCKPPCCCKNVVLKFVCDSDMNKCLKKLKSKGKISKNYCGTSRTYSCP